MSDKYSSYFDIYCNDNKQIKENKLFHGSFYSKVLQLGKLRT